MILRVTDIVTVTVTTSRIHQLEESTAEHEARTSTTSTTQLLPVNAF